MPGKIWRTALTVKSMCLMASKIFVNQTSLHLISVFFYTGCYNILLEWLKKDLPLTPKEVADLMIRLASENFLE